MDCFGHICCWCDVFIVPRAQHAQWTLRLVVEISNSLEMLVGSKKALSRKLTRRILLGRDGRHDRDLWSESKVRVVSVDLLGHP